MLGMAISMLISYIIYCSHSYPKEGNAEECSNYHTVALISYASKVKPARECPDVQAGFRKAEELEIKLPTLVGSQRNQENSKKTTTFASLTTLKPLTLWIITNCGKFLKRWEYQTTLSVC